MRWLALQVDADVEAVEAVSEIFGRLGRGNMVEPLSLIADPDDEQALRPDPAAGYRVKTWIPEDFEAEAAVDRTRRALWHLQAFDLRPMGELAVTSVDDADWATAWREGYAPMRIGRLSIVPTWLQVPADAEADGGAVLRLDPGMAFGTGLHPTTRLCLELLQRVDPLPPDVLDVGTGSGILALAALRFGASRVVGYDTDPLAVEVSHANADANGLSDRFAARSGSLPEEAAERFGLVLANLVAAVLVELAPRLAAHTARGGTLIASGIIENRRVEVERALAAVGFTVAEALVDADWVALRLERAA
jgi:ribosomal protein L11 methyltransferase